MKSQFILLITILILGSTGSANNELCTLAFNSPADQIDHIYSELEYSTQRIQWLYVVSVVYKYARLKNESIGSRMTENAKNTKWNDYLNLQEKEIEAYVNHIIQALEELRDAPYDAKSLYDYPEFKTKLMNILTEFEKSGKADQAKEKLKYIAAPLDYEPASPNPYASRPTWAQLGSYRIKNLLKPLSNSVGEAIERLQLLSEGKTIIPSDDNMGGGDFAWLFAE